MSYQSKNSLVRGRQLKVQRLVIPFSVTASATPSAVSLRSDEPSILFLKSEGVDQISAALAVSETATYSVSPNDANGILNLLVKIQSEDSCAKVMRANVTDRVNGGSQPCKLGDADGISSAGNIMLTMDSSVDFTSTSLDACLEVEYVVAE